MSGGGLKLKDFQIKAGWQTVFLHIPHQRIRKKGLVSVEVKKKKGQ